MIEIDSNSWAGNALIPNDPNVQNGNGKLLQFFLQRNKGMTLVNSLSLCQGIITRKRVTGNKKEQAAMDLFIVCKRILPLVIKMHVDEHGEHQLSNFYGIQHNRKVTESDHAKIELKLNLQCTPMKPTRTETFNFKSDECQKSFKSLTTHTRQFTMCFENTDDFPVQVKNWQRNLKSSIAQSFYKIRSRKRKFSDTIVGKLIEERKRIKLDLVNNPSLQKEKEKVEVEAKIAEATESQYMTKIQETLGHMTGDDGGVNTNGFWKAKNNLIPKDKTHNPVALKDRTGNMITNPEGI